MLGWDCRALLGVPAYIHDTIEHHVGTRTAYTLIFLLQGQELLGALKQCAQ